MKEERSEISKKIHYLALSTRRLVLNHLIGAYRSAFQGRGMEFLQVRPFETGDDIRHMDWNVTARMRHPYVKTFQEEHALSVLLIVDISGSMYFGSQTMRKSELAAEVAALVAFSALENNDQIGLLLFAQDVELYLPPNSRQQHVMRILKEILTPRNHAGATGLNRMIQFLGNLKRRPDLCFFISDLQTPLPLRSLRTAAKRSDWIALQIQDPLEKHLPHAGLVHLKDCETGDTCYIDSSDPLFQKEFTLEQQRKEKERSNTLKQCGVDLLSLSTAEPYEHALQRFFLERKRKTRA